MLKWIKKPLHFAGKERTGLFVFFEAYAFFQFACGANPYCFWLCCLSFCFWNMTVLICYSFKYLFHIYNLTLQAQGINYLFSIYANYPDKEPYLLISYMLYFVNLLLACCTCYHVSCNLLTYFSLNHGLIQNVGGGGGGSGPLRKFTMCYMVP